MISSAAWKSKIESKTGGVIEDIEERIWKSHSGLSLILEG
jgi:hypothetical protein